MGMRNARHIIQSRHCHGVVALTEEGNLSDLFG